MHGHGIVPGVSDVSLASIRRMCVAALVLAALILGNATATGAKNTVNVILEANPYPYRSEPDPPKPCDRAALRSLLDRLGRHREVRDRIVHDSKFSNADPIRSAYKSAYAYSTTALGTLDRCDDEAVLSTARDFAAAVAAAAKQATSTPNAPALNTPTVTAPPPDAMANPFAAGPTSQPANPFAIQPIRQSSLTSRNDTYDSMVGSPNRITAPVPEEKGKQDCRTFIGKQPWFLLAQAPSGLVGSATLEWQQHYSQAFSDCINSVKVRLTNNSLTGGRRLYVSLTNCVVSGHRAGGTGVGAKPGEQKTQHLISLTGISSVDIQYCELTWRVEEAN